MFVMYETWREKMYTRRVEIGVHVEEEEGRV